MPPKIIDGRAISAAILQQCKQEVDQLKATHKRVPGLAVVLVGEDPASRAYVRSKERTCLELGFHSIKLEKPEATTQEELLEVVQALNNDPQIDGILVQSPLPKHIDEAVIVKALDPRKDVDGFHPENVAKLALGDPTGFVPCTPLGCQELLVQTGVPISGAHVVILGRSLIVGKSLALLLMQKAKNANATVTIAHSQSQDLSKVTQSADILVAAIGRPNFVKPEHVRPGTVVIDVGINRIADSSAKSGYRLVGDVDYQAVAPLCTAITPVPGGVGPMTIAMLMRNTLKACAQNHP